MQGIQQRYGLVCAQIKALDSYLSQPVAAPAQAEQSGMGQAMGNSGSFSASPT